MLTLRRMHVEAEFVKWMILLAIAAMIAMFLVTRMAAGAGTPGLLPDDMNQIARPMPPMPAAPFYPEVGPATNEPHEAVWRILEMHRLGQVEDALAAWQRVDIPLATEVWRNVAIAAANLQVGNVDQAEEQLDAALEAEPRNAVVRYYLGMLRLAQAGKAHDWPDMVIPPRIMLIALPEIVPNTRAMYELAAMQEFAKAIEMAPEMNLDAVLVFDAAAAGEYRYVPMVMPTVRDLLEALGADRFPARAHNVLGEMNTERGMFEEAEVHLDAAAAQRMNAPLAYRHLAEALEADERYDDATRVYMKAFRNGDVNLIPALRMMINGWKAADTN